MTTFLTAQEMQELISVDRSTVYRMAEDGRLPAVKVGRQWRFPADQVAARFGLQAGADSTGSSTAPPMPSLPVDRSRLSSLLELGTAEPIAEMLGDLFGVMAVITDMDGTPLTPVTNQCGFYRAVGSRPETAEACVNGWRQLAAEPNIAPRFVPSHFGFLCARTFVWVDLRPVGMVVVGGVTPESWPPSGAQLAGIAAEAGLAPDALAESVRETWDVPVEQQERILQQLPKFGDLISQLASARSRLLAGADDLHRREAS
jgi:excisionase family DNA binding protein